MNRKGQGISINVVIIAAIALLILVILSVLVLRTGRDTSKAGQCESIPGATCRAQWEGDNGPCLTGEDRNRIATCADRGGEPTYCCMRI